MPTQLNMFKFPHNTELWQKLEQNFDQFLPNQNIKMICRLQQSHIDAGFRKWVTPIFNFPGCVDEKYSSFIISNKPKIESQFKIAVNEMDSYSGKLSFDKWLQGKGLTPQEQQVTGAHIESVRAVLEHKVDLAAIDCVSWAYIQNELPEAKSLHIMAQTELVAGHPIVIQEKENISLTLPELDSELLKSLGISAFKLH